MLLIEVATPLKKSSITGKFFTPACRVLGNRPSIVCSISRPRTTGARFQTDLAALPRTCPPAWTTRATGAIRAPSAGSVGPVAALTVKLTGADEAELVWLSAATADTE